MIPVEGVLRYNRERDCYGLQSGDQWQKEAFHCGDTLEILMDGKWVPTRIEMEQGEWYLVKTPYRGDLENIPARLNPNAKNARRRKIYEVWWRSEVAKANRWFRIFLAFYIPISLLLVGFSVYLFISSGFAEDEHTARLFLSAARTAASSSATFITVGGVIILIRHFATRGIFALVNKRRKH